MTSAAGIDYATGTTYQPKEHVLPLGLNVLKELYKACEKMVDGIAYQVHDDFILVPK